MASQPMIYFRQAQLGPMANFVYLIGDPVTRKAAVVDGAWDVDAIISTAESDGYLIDKLLVSHYHPDHLGGNLFGQSIAGATELVARLQAKVYINREDAPYALKVSGLSESDLVKVDAGDVHPIGQLSLKFIHTPGHTPGSQCFLIENNLISGDTLFIGSCGRIDLPGSDPEQMYYSLNQTLRNLDDATVVYPGHAYAPESSSTIGREKRSNPYMRFNSLAQFLEAMGYGD